ncbi:tyrosine--tRNA ligase [Candidatus Woesebacteria bacterium RBG_19FT_COMBO_47_8]|uniref:Tyrosine--tRNA ligase n=1 Tax=Candidatus Woesebacteria bacterium RBG_13_46_13 TaxID=1802479 RepID=A0A1F7X414_9BACT|nr:MAG: tyrosine--tRNA ligase [Candidatus Woesebacteria bacterium RBG_13_46_13]OGM17617.1 MAG: tyrosine--tRNA ligase [Candidatus Woesebacteria bacterium RBG_19FT_COMBO_47_8]HJX59575.1 tyrosine--tRNA ligase [Patescibacteria group bacterium]
MNPIDEVLTRGVAEILPSKEGLAKIMAKGPITLYQGFDPSMPSLHLGNLVGLLKLSQFQELGHKVIFLVGDFTGMIGDPTDKLATRKQLSPKEVKENVAKWKEQAAKVLDFEGPNPAKMLFNSEWLSALSMEEFLTICANLTVPQLIERDMFQKRLKEEGTVRVHEFLYPVLQGYDSVAMDVDLEIGGSDQIFNMLVGRTLMQAIKGKEKFVLGTKLLVDKEGNKVGKTTGNALFLDSSPENFYAGIMSFPDTVLPLAYELLTSFPLQGIEAKVKKEPLAEKKRLAYELVKLLWGGASAEAAQKYFERTFQERAPSFDIRVSAGESLAKTISPYTRLESISDAKRIIKQHAVDINGKTVSDAAYVVKVGDKIRVGERTFLIATK